MRIIHTSDWHLGQHFFSKSRLKEHQGFLTWLLEMVETHRVDAIVVAGDVFDTGSPPSYARQLYNQFIVDLQQHHCQLVVLAGNHDSVSTLNESTNLLACLNTYVIASSKEDIEKQVLTLNQYDEQGNVQPGCVLCAIPFLRPRDVMKTQAGQSSTQKQHALQQGIAEHYQQVYERARQIAQQHQPPLAVVATGHLTTIGASKTDSVRDIYIGTLDAFPANQLPPADYIALGHIHRSQKVTSSEHIRYCGSPIPLSFDELSSVKSVNLVELNQGLEQVTELAVPTFQPLKMIKGDLAEIEQQLLLLKDYDPSMPVWLDIEVATQEYLTDLQQRIEQLTKELPVEVLLLRRQKAKTTQAMTTQVKETLNELNAEEVFARRLELEAFDGVEQQQRLGRIKLKFSQVSSEAEKQLTELESH